MGKGLFLLLDLGNGKLLSEYLEGPETPRTFIIILNPRRFWLISLSKWLINPVIPSGYLTLPWKDPPFYS